MTIDNAESVNTSSDSETLIQEVAHDNGYDFDLIIKWISKLEAENIIYLQTLLINDTSGMNQQQISKNLMILYREANWISNCKYKS